MAIYTILEYLRNRRILKNDDRHYTQKDVIERTGVTPITVKRSMKKLVNQGYLETQPVIRAGRPYLGYRHVKDDRWLMALSAVEIKRMKEEEQ